MLPNEICANCSFAKPVGDHVECRRFPPRPVAMGYSTWPTVPDEGWCGEWLPNTGAGAAVTPKPFEFIAEEYAA